MAILTFRQIQCLHLMYAEVTWVLVSLKTQVQPQIILDTDYLPDCLPVSYDYGHSRNNLRHRVILQIFSFATSKMECGF